MNCVRPSLALHDIHKLPGVLIELQLHLALFVHLEVASGEERTRKLLFVLTDGDWDDQFAAAWQALVGHRDEAGPRGKPSRSDT